MIGSSWRVLVVVVLVVGCASPTAMNKPALPPSFTLHWELGTQAGQPLLRPQLPLAVSFDVVLHPASGSDVTATGLTGSSWTAYNLLAQSYAVTITGKTTNGLPFVLGNGFVDLSLPTPANPTIVLNYISSGTGTGQIHVTLDFSAAEAPISSVVLSLVDPAGTLTSPTLTGDSTLYTNLEAPVGTYKLVVRAQTATKTALRSEDILVVQNLDTAAALKFLASDFNADYVPVTSLTLNKTLSTLTLGTPETLTVAPNNGASNPLVSWTSSDRTIADVDQNGVVTGVSAGNATITATSVDNPSVTASCGYTVKAVPVARSLLSEGFETGDLSAFPWAPSGSLAPSVTSVNVYAGAKAADFETRNLASGQSSVLSLPLKSTEASIVSFWLKTDIGTDVGTSFQFFVDGILEGEWNGLGKPWMQVSFRVATGFHTLKWQVVKNSGYYYSSATNAVYLDDLTVKTDISQPVTDSFQEGFETGDFASFRWVAAGDLTPGFTTTAYTGTKAAAFETRPMGSGQSASLSLPITPAVASSVSFWIKTDIGTDVGTSFQFLVDGVKAGEWNGLGKPWTQVWFPVSPGPHTLRWQAVKTTGSYYPSHTNAVYLDNVALVADVPQTLVVSPKGTLDFYSGMTGQSFQTQALRSDGTVKPGVTFSYSVQTLSGGSGSISAAGVFTPTTPGTCRVVVKSSEGLQTTSNTITVHAASEISGPLTYAGSFYSGKASGGSGNPLTGTASQVQVTSPTVANFDADGFLTLQGVVDSPVVYNYALVKVVKDGSLQETDYFVRSAFSTRLWLRFGAGAYTVTVYRLASLNATLNGEGDFTGWSWYNPAVYTFHVYNTRNEDGTFFYPSDPIQSDDVRISNLANDLTWGLTTTTAKVKAVHDYVVQALYYDNTSFVTPTLRKKQDALFVLDNGTAVCEGYTSLTDALLRSLGIKAKAVSGLGNGGAHAWTNVLVDGSWLFLDATWDDPYPQGDNSIAYDYFLLTSLTGVNGDHVVEDARIDRGIVASLPRWKGRPDGWY